MKVARLMCSAFAVSLVAGWATPLMACDDEKKTTAAAVQATAAKEACSADMKAAKVAGTATDDCCATKNATTTAKAKGKSKPKSTKNASLYYVNATPEAAAPVVLVTTDGATAVTADTKNVAGTSGSCASKSASAYTASSNSCASKATSATAVTASSNGAKKSSSSCASKGTTASASHCAGQGMAVMAGIGSTEDCEACFDMVACGDALTAVGAHRQTVRLKNGVMYVFTADSQRNVNAVQSAMARRGDQMSKVVLAGDNVKLCSGCKSLRGAIASGKLNREVVNIEGGTLTLITSSDAELVTKIHAMTTDAKVAARIKS